MKVAFDVDGVLLNFDESSFKLVAQIKNCSVSDVIQKADMKHWELQKRFDLTDEQMKLFWEMFDWFNIPAYKNIDYVLEEFIQIHGINNIYFVTSLNIENRVKRIENLKKEFQHVFEKYTENVDYFLEHHVKMVDIGISKNKTLNDLEIQIFIEDRFNNLYDAIFEVPTLKHIVLIDSHIREQHFEERFKELAVMARETNNFTFHRFQFKDIHAFL